MPAALQQTLFINNFASYLTEDQQSQQRLELIDSVIIAMAGATENQNLISHNISNILGNHLYDSECRVMSSDMKTKINDKNCYYPDVGVYCEKDDNNPVIKESPLLVVEVLSESTKSIDLTIKRQNYFIIPTLMEYLILYQDQMRAILFSRAKKTNQWLNTILTDKDTLTLNSVDLTISLHQLYHKVVL